MKENLNKYIKEIHEYNVAAGGWGGNRCILTALQLVSTGLAEATEGLRKNLQDTHLPQYRVYDVALADALICALDTAGKLKLTYSPGAAAVTYYGDQGVRYLQPASQLFVLGDLLSTFGRCCFTTEASKVQQSLMLSRFVNTLLVVAARNTERALEEVMLAKLEYNRHRLDHKSEHRKKPGGKKF